MHNYGFMITTLTQEHKAKLITGMR